MRRRTVSVSGGMTHTERKGTNDIDVGQLGSTKDGFIKLLLSSTSSVGYIQEAIPTRRGRTRFCTGRADVESARFRHHGDASVSSA